MLWQRFLDYWNTDDKKESADEFTEDDDESTGYGAGSRNSGRNSNPALNSYRNAQKKHIGEFLPGQQFRKQWNFVSNWMN